MEDPNSDPNLRVALQRRWLGYGLEARAAARAMAARWRGAQVPEKRFLIFGRGRSGSTLLTSLLNGHSQITCLGEILRYRSLDPVRQLRHELAATGTRAAGCKLLSYQMRNIHGMPANSDMLAQLVESGVQIIYLKRDNLVRHAVSNLYARKRRAYHSSDRRAAEKTRVVIEPEEIFAWMEGSAALGDYEAQVLSQVPHVALSYEQNLSETRAQELTYRNLLDSLGLNFEVPQTSLRKVTPSRFEDTIENHASLLSAISGSRYAHFLDG
jgi:hypothetical protein